MEGQSVVVGRRVRPAGVVLVGQGAFGKADEVRNRLGGMVGEHRDVDVAEVRVKGDVHAVILACALGSRGCDG